METPAYTGYINLYYNLVHQSTSHYFKEYCRQQLSGKLDEFLLTTCLSDSVIDYHRIFCKSGPGGQGSVSSNGQAGPRPPGTRFNGPGTGQPIPGSEVSGGQGHLQNSPGVATGGMNSYNWSEAQQHHPQQQQQTQPQQHLQQHAPQQLTSQSNQPQQAQAPPQQQPQEHRNNSTSHQGMCIIRSIIFSRWYKLTFFLLRLRNCETCQRYREDGPQRHKKLEPSPGRPNCQRFTSLIHG